LPTESFKNLQEGFEAWNRSDIDAVIREFWAFAEEDEAEARREAGLTNG
jgi:hypothetical protein